MQNVSRNKEGLFSKTQDVVQVAAVSTAVIGKHKEDIKELPGTLTEAFVKNDDLSLKGPLSAVRKSVQAATMIQFAFRSHSFHLRQCSNGDDVLPSDLVALAAGTSSNKVQKVGPSCFDDYLHSSAIRIQKKYRGWKGRKDFLRIRNRIVRI